MSVYILCVLPITIHVLPHFAKIIPVLPQITGCLEN